MKHQPMHQQSIAELQALAAELRSHALPTKKQVRYLELVELRLAELQQPAPRPGARTRAEWHEFTLAASHPSSPFHHWQQASNAYYARADHLRYPHTHKQMLRDGLVQPLSQADLDLIAAPEPEHVPVPAPPHIRAQLEALKGSMVTPKTVAQIYDNIFRIARERGYLSYVQAAYLHAVGHSGKSDWPNSP
jgi:hypothetical protein